MKTIVVLFVLACSGFTQTTPVVELIHFRNVSFDAGELSVLYEVRMLKITAPAGAKAYQVDLITTDTTGVRQTWSYIVPRSETRYGKGVDNSVHQTATFFSIPIALDILITDYWVTTLVPSGDAVHIVP